MNLIARIRLSLLLLLGFFISLSIAAFFLAATGQANAFPTYLAALTLIIYLLAFREDLQFFRNVAWAGVFGVIVYLWLSTLWSAAPGEFLRYLGYALLLAAFIAGLTVCSMRLDQFLRWLMILLVIAASISATFAIFLFFKLPDYQPLVENRLVAMGRLHNPAVAAYAYGVSLVSACFLGMQGRSLVERGFWTACVFILITALVIAQTRGVWTGVLAGLVALVWFSDYPARWKRWLLGALVLVLLAVIGLIFYLNLDEELARRALSFRPEIWAAVLEITRETNLWLGLGINATSELKLRYTFDHAHSVYFGMLYHGGLMGLALLAAMLGLVLRELWKRRSASRHLALGLMAFAMVTLIFDGDRLLAKINYMWMVFWLPVAIALAAISGSREKIE